MAEATLAKAQAAQAKAEADNKMADAEKGKTKLQMMDKYMELLYKDTTGYDEVTRARHEDMLAYLATQLFSWNDLFFLWLVQLVNSWVC